MMKRLLLGICMLLGIMLHANAKVYLVSVGVADYPGTNKDLRVSDNDAITIGKIFNATKDADVRTLTNGDATRSALLSAMRTSFAEANYNDAVILYFSGHGAPGALACYDGQLTYQHIFNIMKDCKASRKIIIIDACFSGKMRTTKQQSSSYTNQDVMLFLSSRTTEPSLETDFKNSLFTIYLERGLRGGADTNKDRHITARELYNFVHKGVIEASGNKQHPVMWGKFDDNMTVIKW